MSRGLGIGAVSGALSEKVPGRVGHPPPRALSAAGAAGLLTRHSFLAALGLAGWAGADAAARPNGSEDAVMPRREARTGDVVVQRSVASPNVAVVVDGRTNGEAADGIADRVFVLQRDGAPSDNAVLCYAGARVLFDEGTILVAPADGNPAVGLFLVGREALSPAAASSWVRRRSATAGRGAECCDCTPDSTNCTCSCEQL